MTEPPNPWLPPVEEEPVSHTVRTVTAGVLATGPEHPQAGVRVPDQVDQLPVRPQGGAAALWIVGAHGGSSESTVASLSTGWRAAGHAWPQAAAGSVQVPVAVVARTSTRGLQAAKAAAKQWAGGLVPGVRLVGLILVDDAPGRLPRPLRELSRVVAGGYPRTWRVPWMEAWRLGEDVSAESSPREVRRMLAELNTLLQQDHAPL